MLIYITDLIWIGLGQIDQDKIPNTPFFIEINKEENNTHYNTTHYNTTHCNTHYNTPTNHKKTRIESTNVIAQRINDEVKNSKNVVIYDATKNYYINGNNPVGAIFEIIILYLIKYKYYTQEEAQALIKRKILQNKISPRNYGTFSLN